MEASHQRFRPRPLTAASVLATSATPRDFLVALAQITGIPMPRLRQAERRLALTGSLEPLAALLDDPTVPRTGRLKYRLGLERRHLDQATCSARVASRLVLAIHTERGQLIVDVRLVLQKRRLRTGGERRVAQLAVTLRVDAGDRLQAYRQELTLAA